MKIYHPLIECVPVCFAIAILGCGSGCVSTQQHLMMQAMMTHEYRQLETAYHSLECALVQCQADNAQLRQAESSTSGKKTSREEYRPPAPLELGERNPRVPPTLAPALVPPLVPEWSPDF